MPHGRGEGIGGGDYDAKGGPLAHPRRAQGTGGASGPFRIQIGHSSAQLLDNVAQAVLRPANARLDG